MAVVIDTFMTVCWAIQRLIYIHKPQIIEDHRYYLSCKLCKSVHNHNHHEIKLQYINCSVLGFQKMIM